VVETNKKTNIKTKNIILIIVMLLAITSIATGIALLGYGEDKVVNNHKNNLEVDNESEEPEKSLYSVGKVDKGTNTTYDENGAFLFNIEDVFTITGKGTVVTGSVQRGTIKVGDKVQIIGLGEEIITTEVIEIEMFRVLQDEVTIGDNAGIILKDVERDQITRGQVLAKPNSIVASTKFDADVYILSKEEGGRQTPIFTDYHPQFYFGTIGITGVIDLPSNVERVNPGEDVSFTATLETNVAMEVGIEFSIIEGEITVGRGKVTKVY